MLGTSTGRIIHFAKLKMIHYQYTAVVTSVSLKIVVNIMVKHNCVTAIFFEKDVIQDYI